MDSSSRLARRFRSWGLGAGKSTLLHPPECWTARPTERSFWPNGTGSRLSTPSSHGPQPASRLRVPVPHLLLEFSAAENVALPLLIRGGQGEADRRARAILEEVGLAHRSSIALALFRWGAAARRLRRALVTTPVVILADEPSGNSTGEQRAAARPYFRPGREKGWRRVATHDERLAERTDRLLLSRTGPAPIHLEPLG